MEKKVNPKILYEPLSLLNICDYTKQLSAKLHILIFFIHQEVFSWKNKIVTVTKLLYLIHTKRVMGIRLHMTEN